MSVAGSDSTKRDAASDDGAAAHSHGSFFGRRKGHKLRAHQADLIEHLLPRLALDIGQPSPPDLAHLFDPPADAVRLKVGTTTARLMVAVLFSVPDVPVTVTVDVPATAAAPAANVTVLVLDVLAGLNAAVTPAGSPDVFSSITAS